MAQVFVSDYFYGDESKEFSYFRIPRLLITHQRFKNISVEAKLLYGLLLDRMGLSEEHGWYDEDGRVFIYYTVEEIADDLCCGRDKAMKLLAELDKAKGAGLIERVRQGQGKPTKIYVKPLLAAIEAADVRAVSHITGGGFYENIPRMLKDGTRAKVYKEKFEVLPIFKKIQEKGGISEHDMYNTYNMGVGMMFVVPESQAEEAVNAVNAAGEKAFVIGEITEGEKGEDIC